MTVYNFLLLYSHSGDADAEMTKQNLQDMDKLDENQNAAKDDVSTNIGSESWNCLCS